jgi:AraC family transcriptional regulator
MPYRRRAPRPFLASVECNGLSVEHLCSAESAGNLAILVLSVPKQSLAFALADRARPASRLLSRLDGRDETLARLSHAIAGQAAAGFPEGPLRWDELTDAFIDRLIDGYLSAPVKTRRGLLDHRALCRARDFVAANIDQTLTVGAIAAAAGQDRAHFIRIFSRTVGVTPHRYVIQARLAHALDAIRAKRFSLAEAAAAAGFTDQSHLSNWARRVYGATLKELLCERDYVASAAWWRSVASRPVGSGKEPG